MHHSAYHQMYDNDLLYVCRSHGLFYNHCWLDCLLSKFPAGRAEWGRRLLTWNKNNFEVIFATIGQWRLIIYLVSLFLSNLSHARLSNSMHWFSLGYAICNQKRAQTWRAVRTVGLLKMNAASRGFLPRQRDLKTTIPSPTSSVEWGEACGKRRSTIRESNSQQA